MTTPTTERAEFITDDMLEYLDELRDTGVTNMFGAAPYVADAFGLKIGDARSVLSYWMRTFSERRSERAQ